eukprot:7901556-Prorocentrum_lima.AAC.1
MGQEEAAAEAKASGRPESEAGTHIGPFLGSDAGRGNFQKVSQGTAPESTSIASSDSVRSMRVAGSAQLSAS